MPYRIRTQFAQSRAVRPLPLARMDLDPLRVRERRGRHNRLERVAGLWKTPTGDHRVQRRNGVLELVNEVLHRFGYLTGCRSPAGSYSDTDVLQLPLASKRPHICRIWYVEVTKNLRMPRAGEIGGGSVPFSGVLPRERQGTFEIRLELS
jgi:hypothetical protein